MARRADVWRKRIAAGAVGVLIGAGLLGESAYMYNSNILIGAVIGAVLVGILFDGLVIKTVSPVTPRCGRLCAHRLHDRAWIR